MGCPKLIYKPELSIYSSKKLRGRNGIYIYKYRYAFNGQERDDDVAGDGNTNTALFWEYDTRLGRRYNLDPKPVAWESLYAVNKDNPIWMSDPLGDVGEPGTATGRAQRKFDKKVTKKLRSLEANGATPEQVQAEADRLAIKYQNKRWLHFALGGTNAGQNYKNSAGVKSKEVIGIKAYDVTVTNVPVLNNRPATAAMTNNVNTGITAPPGSTVTVQFDPLAAPNALTVSTVNPATGATSNIATTGGMIANPGGALGGGVFSPPPINITPANTGQIQYSVLNSNPNATQDNWQLNIQITSAPALKPMPMVIGQMPR